MNADEIRKLQAPLKARYREDPAAAKITSTATGSLLHDRPAVRVRTARGTFDAGLHPSAGGDGTDTCSLDLLLEAVVSCAGVTFNAVATAMSVPFASVTVTAEGDADMRGTLGVAKEAPVGATEIRLKFEVDSPATDEQLATLLRLTERYCVVYQTLLHPPRFHTTLTRVKD